VAIWFIEFIEIAVTLPEPDIESIITVPVADLFEAKLAASKAFNLTIDLRFCAVFSIELFTVTPSGSVIYI
jgi:hypothetical protein